MPIIPTKNTNQSAGICNGTRLIIAQLGKWFIEGQLITGTSIGGRVYMSTNDAKWPFILRTQYLYTLM